MSFLNHLNPSHARFIAEFEQPAQNFESDNELVPDHKSRFVIHLDGFKVGSLEIHLNNNFCYKTANQRLGGVSPLKTEEKLGHVRTLGAFARHLRACHAL